MGINFSTDITPPPLSLNDCLVDGRINPSRYYYYRRKLDEKMRLRKIEDNRRRKKRSSSCKALVKKKAARKHRTVKRHKVMVKDSSGIIYEVKPEHVKIEIKRGKIINLP